MTVEKAFRKSQVQVVSEAWVSGVSTRKMDRLVKTLGIDGISKSTVSEMAKSLDDKVKAFRERPFENGPYRYLWLDATMVKCREFGSVENVAVVIAVGVNDEGIREILGVDVFTSEDETAWRLFLMGLVERGLKGVRHVTSDAHPGLKKAIASVLPGSTWNRCYTHFSRNVLSKLPRKAQGKAIALLRSVTAVNAGFRCYSFAGLNATLSPFFSSFSDLLMYLNQILCAVLICSCLQLCLLLLSNATVCPEWLSPLPCQV